MNYFSSKSTAERYLKSRPFFHPKVIKLIQKYLSLNKPVSNVIDVGCGTGLSTIALKEIAKNIVGTDISSEMIALAPKDSQIEYFVSPGEELPVDTGKFDLMTISSALHWIEVEKFCLEAKRALTPKGYMVVYDNYFSARMGGIPAFTNWNREVYLKKYPSPPRGKITDSIGELQKNGFNLLGQEEYENTVNFSIETLTDYLMTQSNIIAALENGKESIEEIKIWLTEQTKPFFKKNVEGTFYFHGPIWCLQKSS
jgi:ubiquinone/menaquinone biosynthesis C-methylase UbiE